ncbi:hypothetical protein [Cellulomonas dongxiuzhuiae]|uniref:hypothetical protein n=1 Tax=Cellulomonas dongxiuzhuiae TaxID=2819979 RepID=UPI001AAEC560|nr:hypothetical protein [Cellulomonas dongxiuzhuiae]MBO3089714.1 hypothetical protein [Cellulomonas dongxiuzhuiae]
MQVTDWIDSITGVLTLAAAVAAGVYAKRAAHSTMEQAAAAHDQVEIAAAALEVAREDADNARSFAADERREAALAARRAAEDRIDALMPSVLIRATPGRPWFLQQRSERPGESWVGVDDDRELTEADGSVEFQVTVDFHIENPSDHIALVTLGDFGFGEVYLPNGQPILLRSREKVAFRWRATLSIGVFRNSESWNTLRATFVVRDLASSAHDVVEVVLDLGFFNDAGYRVFVAPKLPNPWRERIGQPTGGRVYDRLESHSAG